MSKFCRFCGSSMDDDAVFCASCGKNQAVEESNTPISNNMANRNLSYVPNSVPAQNKNKNIILGIVTTYNKIRQNKQKLQQLKLVKKLKRLKIKPKLIRNKKKKMQKKN